MEVQPIDGSSPPDGSNVQTPEKPAQVKTLGSSTAGPSDVVVISESPSPTKPSQDPSQPAKSTAVGTEVLAPPGKKRGRPPKKSLEAAAKGCKGMSAFLVTPAKKSKTEDSNSAVSPSLSTPSPDSSSKPANSDEENFNENTVCRYCVNGSHVRATIVSKDANGGKVCIQLCDSGETVWIPADSKDLSAPESTGTKMELDMQAGSEPCPTVESPTSAPTIESLGEDVMVIDSNHSDDKQDRHDSNCESGKPMSTSLSTGQNESGKESLKTPPTAMKKTAKVAKVLVMSETEKQKHNERLQEELHQLSKFKFALQCTLPTDQELGDELNCAVFLDPEQAVPMKVRQVIARFVEGSAQGSGELAATLAGKLSHSPGDEQMVETRLEELVGLVAQQVSFCPDKCGDGMPEASSRWNVRDMADMPAEFRSLVEAQHKMQTAMRDRMVHLQRMIAENCAREFGRLEKTLVVLKDRFVKLEDKERKERDKLEAKLEKEKEKSEAKMEKEKERIEAERKKQEEKDEKQRRKEEERKEKEKMVEDKKEKEKKENEVKNEVKKDEEFKPEKPKQSTVGKAKVEKAKGAGTVQQASFMSNFFKKASGPPAIKPSTTRAESGKSGQENMEVESEGLPAGKTRSVFPQWEPPKNAVVASFPFGPGEAEAPFASPEGTDLQSWLTQLRQQKPRYRKSRTAREDGTEHPKMKLIQLNMKLALVRTQLVDVDVDAAQKVVWDVEEDNAEEKLDEILAECDEEEGGLYKYRGRTLQMLTEGGGWFDCRRPPFHGTFRKTSAHVSGTKPLAQDPELDYAYESEVDWESEAGDGEDLGSDLDADDDEEEMEDDEGGFVVPDGMVMEEEDADGGVATVKRLKKLQQEVFYGESVPSDFAAAMAVELVDSMPLILENDENVVLEQDADYFGEDLGSCKAANIELAILAVYKHPLACAFTYIPADSDHRFAGVVFLKGKGAQAHKQDGEGLISGYVCDIPKSKRVAIRKAAEAAAAERAAEAERAKAQKQQQVEPKSKRLAKKAEAAAEQAAAAAAEKQQQAPTTTEEAAAQLLAEKGKAEKKAKAGADKAAAKIAIPDQQLLKLVKLAHGSTKPKAEIVREFLALFPDVPQSKATKYVSSLFYKKDQRHAIVDDRLSNPFVAEVAADVWKANIAGNTPGGGGAVQMTFKPLPV